jgi:hypothetical protein
MLKRVTLGLAPLTVAPAPALADALAPSSAPQMSMDRLASSATAAGLFRRAKPM